MLEKPLLVIKGIGFIFSFLLSALRRSIAFRFKLIGHSMFSSKASSTDPQKSIVIVGASIAGYSAASTIAKYLLPDSPYRVVVVEPRDHFQFTWVLPRFCVVESHEHKAFIPYGPYLPKNAFNVDGGKVSWVKDRVSSITRDAVRLESTGQEIPYEYLVLATGAGATDTLPSRVGTDTKAQGMEFLRDMQKKIRDSKDLVVVGGGAAGVELATDAKNHYPDKRVVLVHSRDAVMHRFGPKLQAAAFDGIKDLGVELITGDRVVREDKERGIAVLRSGKEIACDFLVNCTGQRPDSKLLAQLSPESISDSGHVLTKSTLQIKDESLPNIYACGDVSDTNTAHPNSRSARRQATTVAYNVLAGVEGKKPSEIYEPHWMDGVIKLTLGLHKSVTNIGDDHTEFIKPIEDKDVALMSAGAWKKLGAKPFEDDESEFLSKVQSKI
ncbi:FAD/NAD(P)-binding domain-containing protein [Hypoxylon trugodes]|uniref:FAD/NAD(P)-binding domain-containing protein n=1 Tax=Hypoxylon trugodes TaxID=326681 RepID=UPI0021968DAE|nr:FAD/NAD(P)-binding domain-containing protein [Hypoxylon trugodes]KAI1394261.1 FAD/NAD(P)-binding domain-containing protein [Hypoxylon trugodes]